MRRKNDAGGLKENIERYRTIMNTMTQDSSTGLWNNKNRKIFFWSILALVVILRCIRFATVPDGINQDEAMGAVDAWALSKYGTDRYGTFLPVHFTAWRYSQMSVLLAYCMVPFIKLFGFNTVTVRLPMVLISSGAVALVYLVGRKLFSERIALVAMLLTAVNPWQFMQSRWSLDCNLFPHIFLLGFYLLLLGLEKRRYLYLSMVFFGLTFYCYGIAAYSVTAFLCILHMVPVEAPAEIPGRIAVRTDLYGSGPAGSHSSGNQRGTLWQNHKYSAFTMPYFPDSVRSADILLLNFSFAQLGKNAWALFSHVFLQLPDIFFNSIPAFGPLYHVSIPFVFVGIIVFTIQFFREKNIEKQTQMLALWGFLVTGIWVGLITLRSQH